MTPVAKDGSAGRIGVDAGYEQSMVRATGLLDAVSAWAPRVLVDAIASMSFLTRFNAIGKGVIALQDLLFFVALAAAWLAATAVVIEMKQAD